MSASLIGHSGSSAFRLLDRLIGGQQQQRVRHRQADCLWRKFPGIVLGKAIAGLVGRIAHGRLPARHRLRRTQADFAGEVGNAIVPEPTPYNRSRTIGM